MVMCLALSVSATSDTKVTLKAADAVLSGSCTVRGDGTVNGFSTSDSSADSSVKFTVTVPTAGSYTITLNVAVFGDGSCRIKVGSGEYVGTILPIASEGSHQDVQIKLDLAAGDNDIYIAVAEVGKDYDDDGNFNSTYFYLDYLAYDPQELGTGTGTGTGTGSAGGSSNPDTSDNLVIAVSALALAATGVVIASKKRR